MTLSNNARLCDQINIKTIYDANGTYDVAADEVDMKDWDRCCVMVLGAATTADATHHITGFKIVSNTTSAGAGTDHDIVEAVTTDGGTTVALTQADYGIVAPSTLGDQVLCLDIRADQMYAGDRYIRAVLAATGTFTCVILYIRYNGSFNYKDMIQATRTAFQHDGDI